ncbi:MAG: hypothetical protein IJ424_04070 [Oscillospiraceae bacterium]|nr:hypothetical protein [Oscillospiraceae bacterium]
MKRLFALLVVFIVAFSMVGCADTAKDIVNKTLTRGTFDGNVYTSEYVGIKFTKPDSWVFATEEEMNSLMDAGADVMDQSDYQKSLSEMLTVFDMMASDPETGNNINFVYENLKLSDSVDITEDEYIESFKTNLESIADISYTFGEVETVTLGGVEFIKLNCDAVYYQVVSMKQAVYLKKVGDYMVSITLTLVDGSDASNIEAYFSAIE